MMELLDDVEKLVPQELDRANKNWTSFGSDHEGMSVLLEEIEEAEAELKQTRKLYGQLWGIVKNDGELLTLPHEIRAVAVKAAAEAIQVAAMAQKLADSRAKRDLIEEQTHATRKA